jgi:Spy/CpxP family protein refolding chaperone
MTRTARFAFLVLTLAALPPPLAAAMPPGSMGPMGRPKFLDQLFPPRLVMENQGEINLTPAQREAISKTMAETEKRLVELQWRFEEQSAALTKLLAQPTVDTAAALEQAERVMAVEQEMKKAHLAMLLRIKNQLDATQQEKLRALRGHGERQGRGPGPPPDAPQLPRGEVGAE